VYARRVVCQQFGRARAARCLTMDPIDFIEFVFMVSPFDGWHEGDGKHERMDLAALLLSSSCIGVPIYSCLRGADIGWKKRTEKRESEVSRGMGTGI
jgi:hypothetical protein